MYCDTFNPDFKASLDFQNGYLRPQHYTTNVPLEFMDTLSSGVQRAGACVMLPYVDLLVISQPYASRVENVNPFNVFTYIGRIDLSPASDDWLILTDCLHRSPTLKVIIWQLQEIYRLIKMDLLQFSGVLGLLLDRRNCK